MISICIPTYEMGGDGVAYLEYSFDIICQQTLKPFEVVISDHSVNDEIAKLCEYWKTLLNIKYYKHTEHRGSSSANLNYAISKAKGDIIKILFQDDFLYDECSLEKQMKCLGDAMWLVSACCHYNGKELHSPFYPMYHDNIQYGHNTISSPSVLMIKNSDVITFDEQLVWLMDVDYYKRLYLKFGLPSICNDITIVNREHPNQVSNTLATTKVKQFEYDYIINKYG